MLYGAVGYWGFTLRRTDLRRLALAQPPTLFSLWSYSCRFRCEHECLYSGRRSPGEKGIALAEMPEAGKSTSLLRRTVSARANITWSKDRCEYLEFCVCDRLSGFAGLLNLALLLELREIARCGGVRDMQELLDFIIRDMGFLQKQSHDLREFLLFSELYCLRCFRKEIFDTVLYHNHWRLRG